MRSLLQAAPEGARPRLPPPSPPPLSALAGSLSSRLPGPLWWLVVMESEWERLTLAFSRTSMFPFFDIAHYLVSVMAMKRQPGECGAGTGPSEVPAPGEDGGAG